MSVAWQDRDPALPELVTIERWQSLQDHFTEVLGVGLRTIGPDKTLLVNPSWPTGFDAQRITELLRIGEELEELFPQGEQPRDTTTISRPLGISFAAVPLRVTSRQAVAFLVVGPVILGHREEADQFRRRVAALGLDPEPLWRHWLSIKLYSFASIRSVLRLLEEVGNTLLEVAHQAQTLKALIPDVPKVDQAVVNYYTDRLLQSLLEASAAATEAEGGSVMLYDAQRQALKITTAQGLSDEVIANTRLLPGEGIAGLAVEGRDILLLDEETSDARLKSRMSREGLVSSLVAPLVCDPAQRAVGVLNLRTSNPNRRFVREDVELLRRLMSLAEAALGSLQFAFRKARA